MGTKVPWAVPRLWPCCPLCLSRATPCLLVNSYSAVRTRARVTSLAAVVTSLHGSSFQPIPFLAVIVLQPPSLLLVFLRVLCPLPLGASIEGRGLPDGGDPSLGWVSAQGAGWLVG